MFDVSLAQASTWYNVFNLFLILGAVMVAVATFGSIQMGTIKERFADERISANEKATAEANARSDVARAEAAEANKQARLAELELARFKAPRFLSADQQHRVTQQTKGFPGTPFDFAIQNDAEAVDLMGQIADALKAAGWEHRAFSGAIVVMFTDRPQAGQIVGKGIEIHIAESKKAEWSDPALALANALQSEGIPVTSVNAFDGPTPDAIHIRIGRKE